MKLTLKRLSTARPYGSMPFCTPAPKDKTLVQMLYGDRPSGADAYIAHINDEVSKMRGCPDFWATRTPWKGECPYPEYLEWSKKQQEQNDAAE